MVCYFNLIINQVVKRFLIDGEHDSFQLEGLMESPSVDDDGDCISPLQLNATSINIGVYYNKAVNYTLMVTFVSFHHQYSL
jgi:transmembrane E3 ubiquitin-protein ligase